MSDVGHVWSARWADPKVIFDGLSDDYDRYRPRYATASLEAMLDYAGNVATLLDLGCGTGILTRPLRDLLPRALIVGADPGNDMLAQAAAVSPASLDWLTCRAEQLPFAEASLDLVTVGQAAHWFDRPRFYAECARVLRPGGTLAVLYNNRLRGSPVAEAHEALLLELSPGYTREYRDFDVARELAALPAAREVTEQRRTWDWNRSFEDFIGYVRSTSHYKVACQHRPEAEVIACFAEVLGPLADDAGMLQVPYETVVTLARFG